MNLDAFRTEIAETVFRTKYAHEGAETWTKLCKVLVQNVCGGLMNKSEMDALILFMQQKKFIPGGRYLYYANRKRKFYDNCSLLKDEEDTREDWGELARKALV